MALYDRLRSTRSEDVRGLLKPPVNRMKKPSWIEKLKRFWEAREYHWRCHLGWVPFQRCYECGKWFWGGLPRWWWFKGVWQQTWQAAWCDHCSTACSRASSDRLETEMKMLSGEYSEASGRGETDHGRST